jgi:signal transduction histidine kinase
MMQRNAETYISQKQFIENASHELQTPLAISINKLESLAESADLDTAQAGLLSSAIENLERLTRMNKSLLLLTRIENKQYHDISSLDMSLISRQVAEDFADQSEFRELKLVLRSDAACIVHMNEELAVILVNNLVKNAIIHSSSPGQVELILTASTLEVINRGETHLEQETLFTRFRPGRSTNSTGLGLAIAKAICNLYGFTIHYRFENFNHSFLVDFKNG